MFQTIKKYSVYLLDVSLVILIPILILISKYYFHFFIWIAYVPLIILTYKKRFKIFLFYSLVYLSANSFVCTYYIYNFDKKYFLIAFFYTFFIYFGINLLAHFLYKKVSYLIAIFVFPIIWIVFFTISNFTQGGSSWFNIAVFQPTLSPLLFFGGAEGVTFLILLFNSLVAFFILKKDKKVLFFIVVLLIFLLFCFLYSYHATPIGAKVRVALIQGNFQKDWSWRIENANNEIFNTYDRLSREAAREKPDIIIWPEYAIPEDIFANKNLYDKISQIAKDSNAYLVFGSVGKTELTDPEYNYIKNIAHVFSRSGEYLGGYTSVIPFPFKEKVVPGQDFPVFNSEVGVFGISACWEENYGFINKLYKSKGADFIISIANNEPIGNEKEIEVQALQVRQNAAVNRLYIIRATNTGITEVINPYGKVVAKLEPRKTSYLITDIYVDSSK